MGQVSNLQPGHQQTSYTMGQPGMNKSPDSSVTHYTQPNMMPSHPILIPNGSGQSQPMLGNPQTLMQYPQQQVMVQYQVPPVLVQGPNQPYFVMNPISSGPQQMVSMSFQQISGSPLSFRTCKPEVANTPLRVNSIANTRNTATPTPHRTLSTHSSSPSQTFSRMSRTSSLTKELSPEVQSTLKSLEKELEVAKKSLECPICMSSKIKIALWCGHCTCALCFVKIMEEKDESKCPVCRKIIKSYTVLYIN